MSNRLLRTDDFQFQRGSSGVHMTVPFSGIFALYVHTSVEKTSLQRKYFDNLHIKGLNKGSVDIARNPELRKRCRDTSTPLRKLPMVILFLNGFPKSQFRKDFSGLNEWIHSKCNSLTSPIRASSMPQQRHLERSEPEPQMENPRRRRRDKQYSIGRQNDNVRKDVDRGVPVGIDAAWRLDLRR